VLAVVQQEAVLVRVGLALGRGAGRARAEPPRLDGDDAERRGVARSPGAAVALFRRRGGGGLDDVEAHGPGVGRDQELDLVEDALAVLGFDEKKRGGVGGGKGQGGLRKAREKEKKLPGSERTEEQRERSRSCSPSRLVCVFPPSPASFLSLSVRP